MCNRTSIFLLTLFSLCWSFSGAINQSLPEISTAEPFSVAQDSRQFNPISERGSGRREAPQTTFRPNHVILIDYQYDS